MELGKAMKSYQDALDVQRQVEVMLSKTVEEFVQTQKKGALVVAEFQRLNNNVNYYENELKVQKRSCCKSLSDCRKEERIT